MQTVLQYVNAEVSNSGRNVIVVAGRSRRLAVESHDAELARIVAAKGTSFSSSVSKTVGNVGAALVADGTAASILVVQTAATKA